MAGIVATSATTNNSGDTAADKSVSGYLTNEEITLTASPAGSSYSWSLSAPSGSSRAALTSTTDADPRFTPDVDGFYVVSLTVDGVEYVLRAAVVSTGVVATLGNTRYLPETNAQAPAPSSGITVFYSSDESGLAFKDTGGTVGAFLVDTANFYDMVPQDPAPAYSRGRIFYDGANETFAVYNDQSDVTHQLGQETHVRVVNKTGADISNGKAVYINGAQGNRPTVALANAATVDPLDTIGLTTHDIADDAEGLVTVIGTVGSVDTSSYSAGDKLWLSDSVAGDLTTTKPTAPSARVLVAHALNSTANGRVLVHAKADFS